MVRPQDLRPNKKMGEFNYGSLNMSQATLLPAGDPALWVGNGVSAGLENNGYRVVKVETIKDARSTFAIEIAVTNLATSVETGFFSVTGKNAITAKVSIYRSGQLTQQNEYTGEASESGAQLGGRELQRAVNASLEDFLSKAIPDICAELAKARGSVTPEPSAVK